MKRLIFILAGYFGGGLALFAGELNIDASHIAVFISPYYDSKGPTINVGPFSAGLMSTDEATFLATISKMKAAWQKLTFAELYVAAIRLYDLGYRKEAVYWYYSAEYRGRLFTALLDNSKKGKIGDPGFEILSSQMAFYRLVGPYINGYAFRNLAFVTDVLHKVQKQGEAIPDMIAIYPEVSFKSIEEWNKLNTGVNVGMEKLISYLKENEETMRKQRVEAGTEAKFSVLTSKDLPTNQGR